MGLGGGPGEWDDYEWFSLAALAAAPGAPPGSDLTGLAAALVDWLDAHPVWRGRPRRLLLVDLDNLRADPRRWRARMAFVLALARGADEVALAGQAGAVRRARPHLGELAASARAVADGSDLADYVLLEAADRLPAGPAQIVVLSNDGIFASLAERGTLTVISPGGDALSDRLASAADHLVDLARLEADLAAAPAVTAAKKPVVKTVAKKTVAKKTVAKKTVAKKTAAKKTAAKKTAAKKTAAKKTAATKTVGKKTAATKTAAKKAATTTRSTKKAATTKAAKKAVEKAAKKAATTKTTAKKARTRRAAATV